MIQQIWNDAFGKKTIPFATRTMLLMKVRPRETSFLARRSFIPGRWDPNITLPAATITANAIMRKLTKLCQAEGLCCSNRRTERAVLQNSRRARLPTSRPFGHIAPSTRATFRWSSSGPVPWRLVTTMQPLVNTECAKSSSSAMAHQASKTALDLKFRRGASLP